MICRCAAVQDRLGTLLRRQGFEPARAFLVSAANRASRSALGWSPRDFGRVFRRAVHVRRTGPWGTLGLALIGDSAIAYRPSADGRRIVLLGFLRRDSRLWPSAPV